MEARVCPDPVAVLKRAAPASTLSVKLDLIHRLAERSTVPDGTSTVPPDARSPQSRMAARSTRVAFDPLAAEYGGMVTSHIFPCFHPSAEVARAAPGTGCGIRTLPNGPGLGGTKPLAGGSGGGEGETTYYRLPHIDH